jgi:hypothetical protein
MSCWRPYCAVGVPADYSCCYLASTISGILAVPSSSWVIVAGLPAIAGFPGVASISAVPFEPVFAGSPAVIGFPAVDGVLAFASMPADPGIPILPGGRTVQ